LGNYLGKYPGKYRVNTQ